MGGKESKSHKKSHELITFAFFDLITKRLYYTISGVTGIFTRFLKENPNEKVDRRTFYRAIVKYHETTGIDALLVQSHDHNVDANEKVLTHLLNSEHKKARMAQAVDDHVTEAHHQARYDKIRAQLDQLHESKRLNREFEEEWLYVAIELRTSRFREDGCKAEFTFAAAKQPSINHGHTDDKSDVNIPNLLRDVLLYFSSNLD